MVRQGGNCSNLDDEIKLHIPDEEINALFEELETWEAQLKALPDLADVETLDEVGEYPLRQAPKVLKGGPQ